MNAGSESKMAVRMATNIKPIRISKLCWIAIGSTDANMNIGPLRHRDIAEDGILRRPAIAELI
jgi:hypothetical protein